MLKVEGAEDKVAYSGKELDSVYVGDMLTSLAPVGEAARAQEKGTLTKEGQIAAGKVLFAGTCSACHRDTGEGVPGAFPPLAKSDYLASLDIDALIKIVLNGLSGKVTVNGKDFNSVMPPQSQLADDDIANILTFVLNSWGNPGGQVKPEQVAKVRKSSPRPLGAAH
jgi:nitrite reductase (NO-forming)